VGTQIGRADPDLTIKMRRKTPLDQKLFAEPERFQFFQAVRLLERLFPAQSAVGRDPLPENEAVRFRSHVMLNFPPSEIHSLEELEDEEANRKRAEMYVNFMGMAGITGVLPIYYSELIVDRERYGDTALWAFLDIFSHRSVSLFFRAWEKYRFPVAYERGNDDFTAFLFDFVGLGTQALRGKLDIDDESLLPYGGLIIQRPHSASALKQVLSDYFGVDVEIEQFSGQWIDLDDESITRLGHRNSTLGTNTVIGTRVWDHQSKFRVVMGPLKFKEYADFLPNGTGNKPLRSLTRFMAGDEFDFDIQLKLKKNEVPGCVLTTRAQRRPMLGWTSFLKTKPFDKDDDQLVLQTEN
jgi:type VI secretion system protein ImpH